MDFTMERVKQMLILLKGNRYYARLPLNGWRFCECGYKTGNLIPDKKCTGIPRFWRRRALGKKGG